MYGWYSLLILFRNYSHHRKMRCTIERTNVRPYLFSISQIGFLSFSPLICGILTNFFGGMVIDWLAVKMAKRNNGIYEPEFRLPMMILSFITGGIGFYGFAISMQQKLHWIAPCLFLGCQNISGSLMGVISNTYIVDCHRQYAQECYGMMNFLKQTFTFGWLYFTSAWLTNSGPLVVFSTMGAIHLAIHIAAIPMYIWGKQMRGWVHHSAFHKKMLPQL